MILQAVPPTPPSPPPFDPNLIFMQDGGPPFILMIVLAGLAATVIILWPIMRADFAERILMKSHDRTELGKGESAG